MSRSRPVPSVLLGLALTGLAAPPASPQTEKAPSATADPTPGASSRPAEVRGRVSGPDGKPIAGATVRVVVLPGRGEARQRPSEPTEPKPVVVKTGGEGSFRATGLTGESFSVRVEADGKAPFTAKEIPAGASVSVTLKPGFSLSGRALDQTSGAPLAGAIVEASDADAERFGPDARRRVATREDGRFTIPDLGRGVVTLTALAPAHARASLGRVPVPTPPAKDGSAGPEPVLTLGPGGRLAGRAVLPDGKPAAALSLRLEPRQRDLRPFTRGPDGFAVATDDSGRFAFEGVPAGNEYTLHARKKGYPPAESGPHAVEAGTDRQDIEIRLEEGASFRVRVVDPEGKPVAGVEFALEGAAPQSSGRARREGLWLSSEQVEAGPEGAYAVRALPPGSFNVRLLPPEYDEAERTDVRLRSGETVDLGTVVARATQGISGRVTNRAGEPVADAEVRTLYELPGKGFRSRTAKTKADGRWRITGIGDGPVMRVSATAKGYAEASKERLSPGDDSADFVLDQTGSVLGRVQLAEGGAPLAFSVRAEPESREDDRGGYRGFAVRLGGDTTGTFTDPGGYFRLDDVVPGAHTLIVEASGRPPARRTGVAVSAESGTDVGTIVLEEGKTLQGRVLDVRGERPVAGALLQASPPQGPAFRFGGVPRGPTAVSGPDGSFSLEGLEAGTYRVTAAHAEFAEAEARVEVPAEGPPAELVVRLGRGGRLEGTVRDASKQPVAGARIVLTRGSFGGDAKIVETAADGRYALERLAPGTYSAIRAPGGPGILIGSGTAAKVVAIHEGETAVLDFDETPKVRLSGRVLRGSRPVPSATLRFTRGEPFMPAIIVNASSTEDGTYSVGLEQGGTYTVHVRPSGADGAVWGSFATVQVTVPDTEEARVDILVPAQGISGRVTDPEGAPVTVARVTATRDGASPSGATDRAGGGTDTGGSYSLEGLRPGTYKVTAVAPGYRTAEAYPVIVSDAPTPPVNFALERGQTLRGRVVDPQGRGIQGALVFAAPSGSPPAGRLPVTTDVNGEFVTTAPSEGPVDLAALVAGWAPARATGVTPGDESDEVSVVLRATPGGRIRVQVVGSQGQPVPDVTVTLRANPAFLGSEAMTFFNRPQVTGPDGAAILPFLAPGTYEVSVMGRSDVRPVAATVAEGLEAAATIHLP